MKREQLIKKGLMVGVGVAAYVQEKTEKFAKELIRRGHLNKSEGTKLVKSIYKEADKTRRKIAKVIESELNSVFKKKSEKKKTKKSTKN